MPASVEFAPDLDAWDAWRPEEIARRLAGVRVPWYVAGGWAIDLLFGHQRREHDDLEVAIPHNHFGEIAMALPDLDFFVVGSGKAWPLHQAGDAFETEHQTWGRDPDTGAWRLDLFREPSEGSEWICRRDPAISLPYDRLIARTADGIPYGRPEVVLLFKAKAARPKDEDDFAAALPLLDAPARQWLQDTLKRIHPGHHWIAMLSTKEGRP